MHPGALRTSPPEPVYRPGQADFSTAVDILDLGVLDLEVEATVEWDRDGDWSVTYIRLVHASVSCWHELAKVKAGNYPASPLKRLFLIAVAGAAERALDLTVAERLAEERLR